MDAEQKKSYKVADAVIPISVDTSQVVVVLEVLSKHFGACAEELAAIATCRELRLLETNEPVTDWAGVELSE